MSFLYDPCTHSRDKKQNHNPASAIVILKGGVTEQVKDDFLMQVAANQKTGLQTSVAFAIRKRRKTFAVEVDALARSPDIQRSFLSGPSDWIRTSGTPTVVGVPAADQNGASRPRGRWFAELHIKTAQSIKNDALCMVRVTGFEPAAS